MTLGRSARLGAIMTASLALACSGPTFAERLAADGGLRIHAQAESGCSLTDAATVLQQRVDGHPAFVGEAQVADEQLVVTLVGSAMSEASVRDVLAPHRFEISPFILSNSPYPDSVGRWVSQQRAGRTVHHRLPDEPAFSNRDITSVSVRFNPVNQEMVYLEWTDEAGQRFGDVTAEIVGQPFAIVVDGELLSTPTVMEPIRGGSAQISGLSDDTQTWFASSAMLPALPCALTLARTETVPPASR